MAHPTAPHQPPLAAPERPKLGTPQRRQLQQPWQRRRPPQQRPSPRTAAAAVQAAWGAQVYRVPSTRSTATPPFCLWAQPTAGPWSKLTRSSPSYGPPGSTARATLIVRPPVSTLPHAQPPCRAEQNRSRTLFSLRLLPPPHNRVYSQVCAPGLRGHYSVGCRSSNLCYSVLKSETLRTSLCFTFIVLRKVIDFSSRKGVFGNGDKVGLEIWL